MKEKAAYGEQINKALIHLWPLSKLIFDLTQCHKVSLNTFVGFFAKLLPIVKLGWHDPGTVWSTSSPDLSQMCSTEDRFGNQGSVVLSKHGDNWNKWLQYTAGIMLMKIKQRVLWNKMGVKYHRRINML